MLLFSPIVLKHASFYILNVISIFYHQNNLRLRRFQLVATMPSVCIPCSLKCRLIVISCFVNEHAVKNLEQRAEGRVLHWELMSQASLTH